jgi:hypothetical protein
MAARRGYSLLPHRPTPGQQGESAMQQSKVNAIIATAYNLHIQQGEAMTPAKAAKLPRGDRAHLCKLLEDKGGSDLYTQADAREAFVVVVS